MGNTWDESMTAALTHRPHRTLLSPGCWCQPRWCRRKVLILARRCQRRVGRRWPGSSSSTLEKDRQNVPLEPGCHRIALHCIAPFRRSLTPVADHTNGRRGEDEETFTQQRKLPQHHDLLAEKLDELRHAAGRVRDLHRMAQAERRWYGRLPCGRAPTSTCSFLNLHLGVHAAVEGGDAPGGAGRHQAVSRRGKDGPLVLVEGLQWRVLARALQLESVRKQQRLRAEKKKKTQLKRSNLIDFFLH